MDRRTSARITAAAAALLLGSAVSGCASSDEGGAARPAPPAEASASTPTRDPGAGEGRVFVDDPSIVGARPLAFTTWTPVGADRVAIGFQTGSPECYGVDATATETDRTVVIELRSGARGDAVGRMCTMIAVFGTLEVPLRAPLGDRAVLSAT